jgi:signal transduction histidine kinase
VLEDNHYLPIEAIPEPRSELALPLAMGKTLLGVLDIQSDQVKAFRLDDVPVLQSLADQVAIAIQNASLYEAEKSRRQLTEALYQAGQAISSSLEPEEVLDLILEHLTYIVPYDRAVVALQRRDELEVVAARGFPVEMQAPVLRGLIKEDEFFQHISQTQQPWSIPDLSERQDWPQIEGVAPARSWLGVPLIRFGLVIGMLSLTRESPEPYRDDEIALATTFAGQAAIALENARLYHKIFLFIQELENMVRERTEAVQAAYTQLEHLDRTKSDFINVTAHELRTPLTLLRGYSQMLLKDGAIQENPHHFELISGIHAGALRLQEVVTSMLDIVKIDSRALKLYPEPVSIPSVIQLVSEELTDALTERKQNLIIMEEMAKLPYIEADPDALRKVFYHLIINAIKYTPDGGKITISGRSIAVDDNFVWPGLELVVSDTGIGIDPEFHELIFTKFYQTGEIALHSSGRTKFKGGGPGLGLAIARGIVEAHRGKLWVESEEYNEETYPGSHFHIFLPLRQAKPFQNGDAVEQVTRPQPVSLN